MRDIKFRGWNKQSHIMVDNIRCFAPGSEFNLNDAFDSAMTVLPLQYTGLKDKNSVEIYEGDIVRNRYAKDTGYADRFSDELESVTWNNEYFRFDIGDFQDLGEAANDPQTTLEVIGNIYENPELLK